MLHTLSNSIDDNHDHFLMTAYDYGQFSNASLLAAMFCIIIYYQLLILQRAGDWYTEARV